VKLSEPYIAFKDNVEDPGNHPFETDSGKIEIYSQELADKNIRLLPPIPMYFDPPEGPNDPLTSKYPLQLITCRTKRRAHTQFATLPWLRELEDNMVMINISDAKARRIQNNDLVSVFNDRGKIVIPAMVTERIMPGVINVPQGAWFSPDEKGIDRGGCPNVLTNDEYSPCGALIFNTALVQVEKA
jgi:anaerobic dimethyl sulfoxide reductase subunit A